MHICFNTKHTLLLLQSLTIAHTADNVNKYSALDSQRSRSSVAIPVHISIYILEYMLLCTYILYMYIYLYTMINANYLTC